MTERDREINFYLAKLIPPVCDEEKELPNYRLLVPKLLEKIKELELALENVKKDRDHQKMLGEAFTKIVDAQQEQIQLQIKMLNK